MGIYRIETKNGVALTSSNIQEIIVELSTMEHDEAVKFVYIKDEHDIYYQEYMKEMGKA